MAAGRPPAVLLQDEVAGRVSGECSTCVGGKRLPEGPLSWLHMPSVVVGNLRCPLPLGREVLGPDGDVPLMERSARRLWRVFAATALDEALDETVSSLPSSEFLRLTPSNGVKAPLTGVTYPLRSIPV